MSREVYWMNTFIGGNISETLCPSKLLLFYANFTIQFKKISKNIEFILI